MLELIYPAYSAMVVCNGGGAVAAEMLPIVEPSGLVVAQASRKYCHSGTKVLHPVVHLHIVNREGEVYIQQRSAKKDLLLVAGTSPTGKVSPKPFTGKPEKNCISMISTRYGSRRTCSSLLWSANSSTSSPRWGISARSLMEMRSWRAGTGLRKR